MISYLLQNNKKQKMLGFQKTQGLCCPKSRYFLSIIKKDRGDSPAPPPPKIHF